MSNIVYRITICFILLLFIYILTVPIKATIYLDGVEADITAKQNIYGIFATINIVTSIDRDKQVPKYKLLFVLYKNKIEYILPKYYNNSNIIIINILWSFVLVILAILLIIFIINPNILLSNRNKKEGTASGRKY